MVERDENKENIRKIEISRQLFHLVFGIIILLLTLILVTKVALIVISAIFFISLFLSFILLKIKIPIINLLASKIGRKKDGKFPLKGILFYLGGCILAIIFSSVVFSSKSMALASISVLVFGDSIATIVGLMGGPKYNIKPFSRFKSIYGTIVSIIISFLVALLFVSAIYAFFAAFIVFTTCGAMEFTCAF